LPARNLSIILYDREKDLFLLEYHRDEKDRFDKLVPATKTLTAYMMKSNRSLLLTGREISQMRRAGQVKPIGAPVKAWLGVPLKLEKRTIGALVTADYRNQTAFDQKDVELLEMIAGQIALSIDRKRAEESLKGSEELFRNLAEHSPHMIYVNRMGPILFANKQCEQVFGYTREHFYSPDFDFLTLVAPESRGLIKQNYQQHRQGKEVPPYECFFLTKGGKKIKLHCRTQLITYQGESAIMGILSQMT